MTDIADFIRTRLDEAATTAHDSGPACVAWLTYRRDDGQMLYTTVAAGNGIDGSWVADGRELAEPASARIVYNPASVLADIAAKRRILDMHQNVNDGDCGTCVRGSWGYPTHGGSTIERWPCPTLRALAAPFVGHEDYDPAWRIDG